MRACSKIVHASFTYLQFELRQMLCRQDSKGKENYFIIPLQYHHCEKLFQEIQNQTRFALDSVESSRVIVLLCPVNNLL